MPLPCHPCHASSATHLVHNAPPTQCTSDTMHLPCLLSLAPARPPYYRRSMTLVSMRGDTPFNFVLVLEHLEKQRIVQKRGLSVYVTLKGSLAGAQVHPHTHTHTHKHTQNPV